MNDVQDNKEIIVEESIVKEIDQIVEDTTKIINKKKNKNSRKLASRKIPARIQALFNPLIIERILLGLRSLPNFGPFDLLHLRLVNQVWRDTVIFLPEWVWTRWRNPMLNTKMRLTKGDDDEIKHFKQKILNLRIYKNQETIQPKILALKNMLNDPYGMDLLLDFKISNQVIEKIPTFPRFHIKKARNYCPKHKIRSCKLCDRKNGKCLPKGYNEWSYQWSNYFDIFDCIMDFVFGVKNGRYN